MSTYSLLTNSALTNLSPPCVWSLLLRVLCIWPSKSFLSSSPVLRQVRSGCYQMGWANVIGLVFRAAWRRRPRSSGIFFQDVLRSGRRREGVLLLKRVCLLSGNVRVSSLLEPLLLPSASSLNLSELQECLPSCVPFFLRDIV